MLNRTHRASNAGLGRLLCLLYLVTAVAQSEVVPLFPRLSHQYGLSPLAIAVLLAAPAGATMALALPAGMLTDRLGVRTFTMGERS